MSSSLKEALEAANGRLFGKPSVQAVQKAFVRVVGKHASGAKNVDTKARNDAKRRTKWSVLKGYHVLRHSFISALADKGIDQRISTNWSATRPRPCADDTVTCTPDGCGRGQASVWVSMDMMTQRAWPMVRLPREFPDCKLHECGHEIIKEIEARLFGVDRAGPEFDIILTHSGEDTHADHRVAHESTLSAVRDFHGTCLLFQAPSTKPNGFHPTFFVALDKDALRQKDLSIQAHVSQREKQFTRISRTVGLAGNWSIFLRLPKETYLEAFEVYKSFF